MSTASLSPAVIPDNVCAIILIPSFSPSLICTLPVPGRGDGAEFKLHAAEARLDMGWL